MTTPQQLIPETTPDLSSMEFGNSIDYLMEKYKPANRPEIANQEAYQSAHLTSAEFDNIIKIVRNFGNDAQPTFAIAPEINWPNVNGDLVEKRIKSYSDDNKQGIVEESLSDRLGRILALNHQVTLGKSGQMREIVRVTAYSSGKPQLSLVEIIREGDVITAEVIPDFAANPNMLSQYLTSVDQAARKARGLSKYEGDLNAYRDQLEKAVG
jgi:hypothetical protein